MYCTGGVFVCGVLEAGNKLIDPRLFSIIPVDQLKPELGVQYHMTPPPGQPAFISLGTDGFRYKIPETENQINDLYERVTQPTRATVPAPSKVM